MKIGQELAVGRIKWMKTASNTRPERLHFCLSWQSRHCYCTTISWDATFNLRWLSPTVILVRICNCWSWAERTLVWLSDPVNTRLNCPFLAVYPVPKTLVFVNFSNRPCGVAVYRNGQEGNVRDRWNLTKSNSHLIISGGSCRANIRPFQTRIQTISDELMLNWQGSYQTSLILILLGK
jgi:hypothetical protein